MVVELRHAAEGNKENPVAKNIGTSARDLFYNQEFSLLI